MNMEMFAQRLKSTREECGVSAKELAEALGINKATIHHYEKADFKSVKSSTLQAIADYLNVNPDYLIGASDEKYTDANVKDLSKKDKKEIGDILSMTAELLKQDGLMFDGVPADEDSVRSILEAMQIGLEIAKRKNKEKYTPKKYK